MPGDEPESTPAEDPHSNQNEFQVVCVLCGASTTSFPHKQVGLQGLFPEMQTTSVPTEAQRSEFLECLRKHGLGDSPEGGANARGLGDGHPAEAGEGKDEDCIDEVDRESPECE